MVHRIQPAAEGGICNLIVLHNPVNGHVSPSYATIGHYYKKCETEVCVNPGQCGMSDASRVGR